MKSESDSALFLSFQNCFCYFGSLAISYEFWNQRIIFCKESSWDSDRNHIESLDQFKEYCHLNNDKPSDLRTLDVFPLIEGFLFVCLFVFNFYQQCLVVFQSVSLALFLLNLFPVILFFLIIVNGITLGKPGFFLFFSHILSSNTWSPEQTQTLTILVMWQQLYSLFLVLPVNMLVNEPNRVFIRLWLFTL